MPSFCCPRALAAAVLALPLHGCIDTVSISASNGTIDLNPRLRGDLGASAGMPDPRFFAGGVCPAGASATAECHYVSQVRASPVLVSELRRLRRANYFWAGSDGFPIISYEMIIRDLDLTDDEGGSFTDLTPGTCSGFPVADPETRRAIPGLERFIPANPGAMADLLQVFVSECLVASIPPVSEALAPITTNCVARDVGSFLNGAHGLPQRPPVCIVNLGFSAAPRDASYSLQAAPAANSDLPVTWPNLQRPPLTLLPNLKVVPVDGVRTISRPLTRDPSFPPRPQPDGSSEFSYLWRVPLEGESWAENFAPEIVVVKARVRRGAWSAAGREYLNLRALEIGNESCQVRVPETNGTEWDVPMCRLDQQGGFRVTPAYVHSRLVISASTPIDDGDRLLWDARVRVPAGSQPPRDSELFLELDLTALAQQTGTAGAGLLAEPAARDLGSERTGSPPTPRTGFTLRNFGVISAWIDSVAIEGRDATEFAPPRIRRPGSSLVAAPGDPPPISAPFVLRAGSTVEIDVTPQPVIAGRKEASLAINYRDVMRQTRTLRTGIVYSGISPYVNVMPQTVYFHTSPSTPGPAMVERAFLIANDGSASFERRGISISGPQAAEFRLVRIEAGLAATASVVPSTIASGASEVYRLRFRPTAAGVRTASVSVETSEGVVHVALQGFCEERCTQPPNAIELDGPRVPTDIKVAGDKPKAGFILRRSPKPKP